AAKYGVALPPRYRPFPPNDGRYYVRRLPWVIGGLEIYEEKDIKQIKPFAWPRQPQEWQLDYWLGQGYSVFVVTDEEAQLKSEVRADREVHEEIHERGTLVATIRASRPLFEATEVKIYLFEKGVSPRAN